MYEEILGAVHFVLKQDFCIIGPCYACFGLRRRVQDRALYVCTERSPWIQVNGLIDGDIQHRRESPFDNLIYDQI